MGDSAIDEFKRGHLHLVLSGKKLKGEWTLIRMRHTDNTRNGGKENWLLLKSGHDVSAILARAEDRSALTGRTLKQIAKAKDAQWQSD